MLDSKWLSSSIILLHKHLIFVLNWNQFYWICIWISNSWPLSVYTAVIFFYFWKIISLYLTLIKQGLEYYNTYYIIILYSFTIWKVLQRNSLGGLKDIVKWWKNCSYYYNLTARVIKRKSNIEWSWQKQESNLASPSPWPDVDAFNTTSNSSWRKESVKRF